MRILTTIPQDDLNHVPAAAKAAEAAGFDGLVTMENRHDPFLSLAVAATTTQKIELLTGVAIAFPRSPMTVANISWDLQAASKGRFTLGLGSQIRAHNEKRFSTPWLPPAPRMRDYVLALRAIWQSWRSGEKLNFVSEHYRFTLMTPNFVPEPFEAPLPRITLAAVGPVMLKVSGEVADGVRLHPFCTRRYLDQDVLPRVQRGLELSGRARDDFEITGGGFIATGKDNESVAKMLEWVRMRVGFYGSTPAYWPVFAVHGLEDLGKKLNAMSKAGQWEAMTKEISDDVVHLFAAVGRHDEIATAIAARFGGVSDAVFASVSSDVPSDLPPDVIQDIQRLPTTYKAAGT